MLKTPHEGHYDASTLIRRHVPAGIKLDFKLSVGIIGTVAVTFL